LSKHDKEKIAGISLKKPRGGKKFEAGNPYRFKPGQSGNPSGRPVCKHSPSEVLQEIERLAFANMLDYVTVTESGEAFVDLSKLNREQASAIQEITVDEAAGGAGDGRRERVQRTRFKLADKGLNLERLGRFHKLFTDKVEVSGEAAVIEKLMAGRKRVQGDGERS